MKNQNEKNEPVEVFAGSSIEAAMIKSILEDAGLETWLKDEYIGTLAPWYTAPGGFGSVKIVVASSSYEQAIEIINNLDQME